MENDICLKSVANFANFVVAEIWEFENSPLVPGYLTPQYH
ncbi:hypothetical protein CES86_0158 [Brucella lupini]|uniref:Uncharacterized protein n=1 Tax=Brucella lupini TaxID=255457 RepID=A0A256GZC8_9HYPH|nr:hypothetical protein CES86_0158 [Brucella lupini]